MFTSFLAENQKQKTKDQKLNFDTFCASLTAHGSASQTNPRPIENTLSASPTPCSNNQSARGPLFSRPQFERITVPISEVNQVSLWPTSTMAETLKFRNIK